MNKRLASWKPEILAPAGSPDCLPAAVAGGADAVYLGLRHFNARGRAENFRLADMPRHMAYLHHHGLKGYVVLNTLLHDDEFNKALEMASQAHAAGIDAVLVQDLGLWHCLRQHIPDLELHASTQMTVHCKSQIDQLAELGARRIVLARELSGEELETLTTYAATRNVETEHFIHGALCYAFSGQCLMSNFSGCRSANRGTCAQNCRYDYQTEASASFDTLISMKDLSLVEAVPQMANAGVASLKIEGRLKGPDYVYTVAHAFRQAVDAWATDKTIKIDEIKQQLKRVFSRGHTMAPMEGVYDQRSRLSRLTEMNNLEADGAIIRIDRRRGEAVLRCRVQPQVGQGFSFTLGQFRDGFLLTHVRPGEHRHEWQCTLRIQEQGAYIPEGTAVYLNSDQQFKNEIETAIKSVPLRAVAAPKRSLRFIVKGKPGEALRVTVETAGRSVSVESSIPLQEARSQSIDTAQLSAVLCALGETDFVCDELINQTADNCFLPLKHLKQLRRLSIAAVEQLVDDVPRTFSIIPAAATPRQRFTKIITVVGSVAAADAAVAAGADSICLDDPQLDLWSAQKILPTLPVGSFIRHSPIRHCSEHLAAYGHGVVAGHIGVIKTCREQGIPVVADNYCNVVNSWTLRALGQMGVSAAILSLECSAREVARLCERCTATAMPELWLCVHGRLPSMLTRQDHGLAAGQQKTMQAHQRDGALPYEMQRRLGQDTVIWEARRLLATQAVVQTRNLVDGWVLELGDLEADGVAAFTAAYVGLRAGKENHRQLADQAAAFYQHPCFAGHLETGSRALDDLQMNSEFDPSGLNMG